MQSYLFPYLLIIRSQLIKCVSTKRIIQQNYSTNNNPTNSLKERWWVARRWGVPCLEEGQQGHAGVEHGQDPWYQANLGAEQRLLSATNSYRSSPLQGALLMLPRILRLAAAVVRF